MRVYNIYVPTEKGKIKIECDQILFIETDIQYPKLTFINNEKLELLLTASEIEYLLFDEDFFRFNDKYLVNLRYVEVIFPSDTSEVVLENGKEIFFDHNKKDELFMSLRKVYDLQDTV